MSCRCGLDLWGRGYVPNILVYLVGGFRARLGGQRGKLVILGRGDIPNVLAVRLGVIRARLNRWFSLWQWLGALAVEAILVLRVGDLSQFSPVGHDWSVVMVMFVAELGPPL